MKRIDVTKCKILKREPRGYSSKCWISDGKNKLLKFNNDLYPDQDLMEKLCSDFFKILNIDVVNVDLALYQSVKGCIVDSFLEKGDILLEVDCNWVKRETKNVEDDIGISFSKVFHIFSHLYDISTAEFEKIKVNYIKMIFGDCILENEDRKLKNVALIFNENSLEYRLAPCFDNALCFHAFSLANTEPVVYIGNQYFNRDDVVEFLVKRNFDILKNIIDNLNNIDTYLIDILNKYEELNLEKRIYIISQLNKTKNFINEITKEKRLK